MGRPKVFAIMLALNQREQTVVALQSLLASEYPELHILVVDNGSTDDTVEYLSATYPEVTLIVNDRNLGFAEGCNVGMRQALAHGAEYVFLMNNDLIIGRDSLKVLVDAAEADSTIGIVGPKIYYWGTSTILQSAGGTINWPRVRAELVGDGEEDLGQYDTVQESDFVSGSALLVKKAVLERVGFLDPLFFLYYEEVDWCLRARRAGFRVVCIPQALAWHKDRGSSVNDPYLINYFVTRNRLLLGSRYANWSEKIFLGLDSLLTLLKAVRHLVWWHGCRGWSRAVLLGMMDFCLGRFGTGSYLGGR
jgi:GT2 family glycosyltransferase